MKRLTEKLSDCSFFNFLERQKRTQATADSDSEISPDCKFTISQCSYKIVTILHCIFSFRHRSGRWTQHCTRQKLVGALNVSFSLEQRVKVLHIQLQLNYKCFLFLCPIPSTSEGMLCNQSEYYEQRYGYSCTSVYIRHLKYLVACFTSYAHV